MKPLDTDLVPAHVGFKTGGLVHGPAPTLPRSFTRAHPNRAKPGRKGAKARARMKRLLGSRFGLT